MLKKTILLLSLTLLGVGAIFISCGDDCPTCPKEPQPPPLGHYRLYVFDVYNHFVMSMDTPADTLVDSIRVDYSGYGLFLTPDGNRLLVTNTGGRRMEIYNAADLDHLGSLDQYGDYFFDGAENIGICLDFPDDNILFIDATTLAPLDSISRPTYCGYIDTVNKLFFASMDSTLYIIDYRQRVIVDSLELRDQRMDSSLVIDRLAHNWKTGELFLQGLGSAPGFYRYDLKGDSVLSSIALSSPFGPVAISPDGEYIYMADGGNGVYDITPIGMIYTLTSDPFAMSFTISPYVWGVGPIYNPYYGDMIIAPDGRRAYICENSNSMSAMPLYVVDFWERKILKKIVPIPYFSAAGVAVGRLPQE